MKARCLFVALLAAVLAQSAAAEPHVFIARHAEKGEGGGGDPKNPELSEPGRARAESLATMLKDAQIAAIYATEFKRTQQTAAPVARAAGLQVTTVPAAETTTLVKKLKAADGNALVIGHSNTVPEIAKALGVAKPPTLNESDYGNLFVWSPRAPTELLRLHFGTR